VPHESRPIATADDAAIWLADLDAADAGEAALALLSEDEHARARRFVFDVHRRRFIACRAWLRTLLGERLGRPAASLRFEYGPVGKPSLAGSETLRFNVSHSDRYGLVGMADGAEIGVDIERLRPLSAMDALADRVFSAAERDALAQVPADHKVEAFFAGWTRKEAYIKARGEGLGLLRSIEVSLSPGLAPRLIRVDGHTDEAQRWSMEALTTVPGFAAAVCLTGFDRHWKPPGEHLSQRL
jgi:4'-phosphopantetheinyl transferase